MSYPKRKHPRLKHYDYSLPGYYYVTVHITAEGPFLSTVVESNAPTRVEVRLTAAGEIVQQQLLVLQQRYSNVIIDKYVIMPTHIHAIIRLTELPPGQKGPSIMDTVGVFKSLATRLCNQLDNTPGRQVFQVSFFENVLRNEKAYQECWRYIDENPLKWFLNPEDL